MTLQEAISKIDDLKPNTFKHPQKIAWISEVDGKIYNEIIKQYVQEDDSSEEGWRPYDENTDMSIVLLVPEPYEEIYIYYMASMIDYWNGEFTRYNNQKGQFNDAYRAFADEYNKTHVHIAPHKFRL